MIIFQQTRCYLNVVYGFQKNHAHFTFFSENGIRISSNPIEQSTDARW